MRDIIAERPDHAIDRVGTWVTIAFFSSCWMILLYSVFAFLASP